jgi:hypothetical protein
LLPCFSTVMDFIKEIQPFYHLFHSINVQTQCSSFILFCTCESEYSCE